MIGFYFADARTLAVEMSDVGRQRATRTAKQ